MEVKIFQKPLLEASWGLLGRSWGLLGISWAQDPKKASSYLLGFNLGAKTKPKWSQVGAKIDPSLNVVLEAMLGWMLGTFFTVLQHMLRLPKYVKIVKT